MIRPSRTQVDLRASVALLLLSASYVGAAQAEDTALQRTADGEVVLEGIVVTAQKRAENVQDVPIAITAISGGQLESRGVTSAQDLTSVAPGLLFSQGNNYAQPSIRGVGTTSTALGDESSVSIFVDGVYYPAATGGLFDLLDVSTIEVLRGPQGTLFGRNATGGAIRINTADPSLDPTGDLELTYGNYDRMEAKGRYSASTESGELGGSLSFLIGRNESFITNIATGRKLDDDTRRLVRGKLKFSPTDRFDAVLAADYARTRSDRSLNRTILNGNAMGVPLGSPIPGRNEVAVNPGATGIVTQYGVSLQATMEFDAFDLVSISAFRNNEAQNGVDADFSGAPLIAIDNREVNETYSQEFQFISPRGEQFEWVAGAFAYQNDARGNLRLGPVPTGPYHTVRPAKQTTESLAAFFDGTYRLTDSFSISGGARYTWEKREFSGSENGVPVVPGVDESWTRVTPRVVATYSPHSDLMFYGSYSRGFKSGTFNAAGLDPVAVDPEDLDAFEIGAKTQPLSWLMWNTSVFYYKDKNLQYQAPDSQGVVRLLNAASARMWGVETEFNAMPFNGLDVGLSLSYLNSEYDEFPNAIVFNPTGTGGNVREFIDASGRPVLRSPEFTANAYLSYERTVSQDWSVKVNANVFASSKYYWDASLRIKQPAYQLVNSSIELASMKGTYVRLWAKNLLDEEYYSQMAASELADSATLAEPRTYGISVGFKFGS